MSDYKDILKRGWHPEKKGETLKSQVKGLVGRGDKGDEEKQRANHVSQPISSLRDPSSFGPPPRHAGLGSGNRAAAPPPPPQRSSTPSSSVQQPSPSPHQTQNGPPRLPPRLPPRTNASSPHPSTVPAAQPSPPPGRPTASASSGSGYLNKGSLSRLSSAGVSVPSLGIGARSSSPSTTTTANSENATRPPPPEQSKEGGGTTWAQKQSALQTAASFRKDPSSVSVSDARAAAKTANNFRQRHGEQVASGVRAANAANEKYGVADRVGGFAAGRTGGAAAAGGGGEDAGGAGGRGHGFGSSNGNMAAAAAAAAGGLGKKKPPPPPPPKKKPGLPDLGRERTGEEGAPPPIPLATRPQF